MKRDMEIVREILFILEEQENSNEEVKLSDNIDKEQAIYHLKIMEQAGLVNNNIKTPGDNEYWIYSSLTWDGHDFLDTIKNNNIWNKTKESIKGKGLELGQVSFSIIKDYAKIELKHLLGI